jgi:two-component system NtrC family sensor kinase
LINGCDAIIEEGIIKVSCRYMPDSESVEIKIQDNGVGMDGDTERRIYEPFFTTKEEGDGVGLGLSVALSIIERHGGSIKTESSKNEGTTFTILLPRFQRDVKEESADMERATKDAS